MFKRDPLILLPSKFLQFHIFFIFTYIKNFIGLALKMKTFKFWRARFGETPHRGTPNFRREPVLLDIYISSFYDPCAVCGLKGESGRRKKKKRKNFIQGKINEYDHDKGRK